MSLDSRLVDLIFTRLLVRYGTAWTSRWSAVSIDDVRADWARELGMFDAYAIRWALDHLPDEYPPTVGQFRASCAGHNKPKPAAQQDLLPAPKPDPGRMAAIISEVHSLWAERKPLQWAYDLQERDKQGDELTIWQRIAWREALAERCDETIGGWFTPIDPKCLPPGMRPGAGLEERTV